MRRGEGEEEKGEVMKRKGMNPKPEPKLVCRDCKRPCPRWAALGRSTKSKNRDIAKLSCPLCGGALEKQENGPKPNGKS